MCDAAGIDTALAGGVQAAGSAEESRPAWGAQRRHKHKDPCSTVQYAMVGILCSMVC